MAEIWTRGPTAPSALDCPTDAAASDGFDRIGLALADPIRRGILLRLLDGPRRPSELAEAIGTSRSNLSNHLACLRGCGLIAATRCGRHVDYELTSGQLADALRSLVAVATDLPDCERHV